MLQCQLFPITVGDTVLVEQVKLLLQLADTLVEKGHAHAPNIKQWVEEVKCQTNIKQISNNYQTIIKQISKKCQTNIKQISNKYQTNIKQISNKY